MNKANWSNAFTKRDPVDPESVDPESVDPESVDPESVDPESVDPEHKRIKFTEKDERVPVKAAATVTAPEEPYYGILEWLGKPRRSIEDPDVLSRMNENKELFIRELGTRFQPSRYSIFEFKNKPNEPLKKAPRIGTPVPDITFNEDIRTSKKIYILRQ
jgi:hypothetical protein